ncbi:MAG TPA: hypothetical protein VFH50_00265 [Acidimicrobiales bacterium]|nr:hypothetical protein [Acidimicrobiales bacterium]
MTVTRLSDRRMARGSLLEAIEVLEATLTAAVIPSRRLMSPVLDMWDQADVVGPATAAPLERLLSHLMVRHHTTREEVRATLAEVRRTLET